MTIVNVLNYGKIVQSYRSDKPIKVIIGKVNPFYSYYCKDSDTLSLHLTKEKYSLPALLSLSSTP